MSKQKSFSLIELTVVIFIIGILATLISVAVVGHQRSARDAQRKSDLNTLSMALEMNYERNQTYQVKNSSGADMIPVIAGRYLSGVSNRLTELGYLSSSPKDPQVTTAGTGNDYYVKFSASGEKSGICLFAKLEIPSDDDTAKFNQFKVATICNYTDSTYNYIVGHK